nr:UBN2 domain-containing protein [Tanacetum cinerariifolium]
MEAEPPQNVTSTVDLTSSPPSSNISLTVLLNSDEIICPMVPLRDYLAILIHMRCKAILATSFAEKNYEKATTAAIRVLQILNELNKYCQKADGTDDQKKETQAKVTVIEESKDLSSLALDELISNLKVHEIIMEKDYEIYKGKKEMVKFIALKAKKESSDDETSTSRSDDKE